MKSFLFCFVLASILSAQVAPPNEFTPNTVIATVEGRNITVAELQKIMQSWPPEITRGFQQNPTEALRTIYTLMYLSKEAEKLKLNEEEPWKEQLEASRASILATAMASHEANTFSVSEQDTINFYERHKSRYEESKIKIIKIGLLEPIPTGVSLEAAKKAAQISLQNSHIPKPRSEAKAATLSADIIKQLKAGANFADLAKRYSEDEDSKASGGDFGTVTPSSNYPDEIKKAVLALKIGEISEPVRQPNALYIIRVESRSSQPIDKVREAIISEIRKEHVIAFGADLGKRLAPKILKPEFFLPSGAPPLPKP